MNSQGSTKPKVKGCYNCSQRRIDCDRTEPACSKCVKKGLECTGLRGPRYRFAHVTNFKTCGRPGRPPIKSKRVLSGNLRADIAHAAIALDRAPSTQSTSTSALASTSILTSTSCRVRASIDWPGRYLPENLAFSEPVDELLSSAHGEIIGIPGPCLDEHGYEFEDQHSENDSTRSDLCGSSTQDVAGNKIGRELDHLSQIQRYFLSYFSSHVAPKMVVIDKNFNGYRDLILPLTELHESVRNAAVAAGAYHFSLQVGMAMSIAAKSYCEAISHLRRTAIDKAIGDDVAESSITTIVVLLICDMITANSGFPELFKVLKSCLQVCDEKQLQKRPLGKFLIEQIEKMRLYAEPLLDEDIGVWTISVNMQHSLSFLYHSKSNHPNHAADISILIDIIQQACDIYLHRAINNVDTVMTRILVEKVKQAVENSHGLAAWDHILVWAYFMVAAESSTNEHRTFFINKLRGCHESTGFANNLSALRVLKEVWARSSEERWTCLIGGGTRVFIM